MRNRAVLIDRDGTINEDVGHTFQFDSFRLIPGALEALQLLTEKNISIFIVTNQGGIAKGLYTEENFLTLTRQMLYDFGAKKIRITDVLYCPHHSDGSVEKYKKVCDCRKPANGLIQRVIDRFHFHPEDMAFIGDKNSDIEAGLSLKLLTYLVLTGYGSESQKNTRADFVVKDLKAAVDHLLQRWSLA